jgi:hypothetical protein
MSVTWGAYVEQDYANVTSVAFAFGTGSVTSGQPIMLFVSCLYSTSPAPTVSDTFSTPYTWTLVTSTNNATPNSSAFLYIGTGGAGTSGTVTASGFQGGSFPGGVAEPAIGASTAAGMAAIDKYGNNQTTSIPALVPTYAGEGAFAGTVSKSTITGYPGSPWVAATEIIYSTTWYGGTAAQPSPSQGSGLSGIWNGSAPATVACLLFAAGQGRASGNFLPLMGASM